jgi:hypothetical protein
VLQPICEESAVTTGVRATIVPTDVPIAIDIKQAAINIPAGRNSLGTARSVSATVASTAPIAFAEDANAPARIKIHTISSIFLCPAPLENSVIRSDSLIPLVRRIAIIDMVMKMISISLFSV